MSNLNFIDWKLFHLQKQALVNLLDDENLTVETEAIFGGILNLLDAVQDEFEPYPIDEEKE